MAEYIVQYCEQSFLLSASDWNNLIEKILSKINSSSTNNKKLVLENIKLKQWHKKFLVLYDIEENILPEEGVIVCTPNESSSNGM